uniref:Homeobox domain-containing protein n=1 Tax=Aotus nancymaae TaxID=37293 RepID=A0A2K5ESL2_AOTNA
MCSAEMPHTETVSPLPSSMDLLIQDSPDSSTSPKGKQPIAAESSAAAKEDKVPVKRQKTRTVFSSAQLCVLNDRFQRQKYLSLQQMQELSSILNLSYKQVKTWFQNQRMKSKRWQKNNWPRNTSDATQVTGNLILFFPFSDLSILSIPETHSSSQTVLVVLVPFLLILPSFSEGLSTHLPQPLLFLPPGMPGEHNWELSGMEQPDLEQFNLEQPNPEHPVLEQPLLEHSDLVHPVLEHSGLEQSLL